MNEFLLKMILYPLGIAEADLPALKPLNIKPLEEGDEIIVQDLPGSFEALWEFRVLGRRLWDFYQENKRSLTLGQIEGLKRTMKGVNDVFWGCFEAHQGKSGRLRVALVTDAGGAEHITLVLGLEDPDEEGEERTEEPEVAELLRKIFGSRRVVTMGYGPKNEKKGE
jgi:hypothetical protein